MTTDEHILVVDDEEHIVRLCVQLLTEMGYRVEGVTDALQALARLEAETYDLLVVDAKMPRVDGLAVLRHGRGLDPNLTAVVITGYATMDKAIEALRAGARGFVLKPFDVDQLVNAVQDALAQRRKEQEHVLLQAQLPVLEIGQALMAEGDVGSLARRLLEVVAQQMTASRGVLMLLDQDADEMFAAAAVDPPQGWTGTTPIPATQGVVRHVLQSGEVLALDKEAWAAVPPSLQAPLDGPDSAGWVLVPLRTRAKNVGILSLMRPPTGRAETIFTPTDLDLLSIIGGQIAIALENARMYALEQERVLALDRALDQQRELTRLKNEFIQNVSHELRTPLALIHGYAELLTSGEFGEVHTEQREPLEIIEQRANYLRALVDSIITMLATESRELARQPIRLEPLVQAAVASFQLVANQNRLTLQYDRGEQTLPLMGDETCLRMVIDQLIDNALKFTPAGGSVIVRLGEADNHVVLQVADTGIGIAAEHLEHIFERFFQVDGSISRNFGGCGLGLALVREIAEAHGGTVTVESQPDQGTTFTVRLPAATAVAARR
jgi:signal transduction histidine kinase/CheY-like chemotaxis protein